MGIFDHINWAQFVSFSDDIGVGNDVSLAVKPAYAFARHHTISDRVKLTFERLRYSLGGDRPSQTAHLTLSYYQFMATS